MVIMLKDIQMEYILDFPRYYSLVNTFRLFVMVEKPLFPTRNLKMIFFKFAVYSVCNDNDSILIFATSLQLDIRQPAIMTQLRNDCCTATGVSCNGNGFVDSIYWNSRGLTGTVNVTALPPSVTILWIQYNYLTGILPNLHGTNVIDFRADSNYLSGSVSLMPPTLKYLVLGWYGNCMGAGQQTHGYGKLFLYQPIEIHIVGNFITDVIIANTSNLITCDLSNTPLLGNPNVVNLTMCAKNNLYSTNLLESLLGDSKTSIFTSTSTEPLPTVSKYHSARSSETGYALVTTSLSQWNAFAFTSSIVIAPSNWKVICRIFLDIILSYHVVHYLFIRSQSKKGTSLLSKISLQ